MSFQQIDLDTWPRREWFGHYLYSVPCSYSMTANLDVTQLRAVLRARGGKLYPATAHMLGTVVNRHAEFRTTTQNGIVGTYDVLHPTYTVFDAERESFSCLWTPYTPDFAAFQAHMLDDYAKWGKTGRMFPQEEQPENMFNLSSIPWTNFTGFQLNLDPGSGYLLPIFTTGKCCEAQGKQLLPIAVQVHHAVCDGYHVSRLLEELQQLADTAEEWVK